MAYYSPTSRTSSKKQQQELSRYATRKGKTEMFKSSIVQNPCPGLVVIKKSKTSSFLQLSFLALFWTAWYSMVGYSDIELKNSVMWLFFLAPLISTFEIIKHIKVISNRENYEISKDTRSISKDYKKIADFEDIERIQIRRISSSEGNDSFRLSLVLKTGKKISIDQNTDKNEVEGIADSISDILEVPVTFKE